ncbi:MAG: hypothetical protein PHI25_00140, partial [Zoogloea sp.]|nr:hypothetical protein [Zoogloea sp.]
PGKPFEVFVAEDRQCRNFAEQSIGIAPQDLATQNVVGNAAVGMVAGTASGASQAGYAGAEAQRRYDIAYQQCMYARGNQLPGYPYGYRQPAPPPSGTPYYPPPPPPR